MSIWKYHINQCSCVTIQSVAMQILAVEVMWTPQDENDSYTRDELFLDYPTLNTL